jgi:hypothetical protein
MKSGILLLHSYSIRQRARAALADTQSACHSRDNDHCQRSSIFSATESFETSLPRSFSFSTTPI